MAAQKTVTRTVGARIVKTAVSTSILRGIPYHLHSSKIRKYINAHADDPYVVADDTTYD